jgi:hypothetical protein
MTIIPTINQGLVQSLKYVLQLKTYYFGYKKFK